MKSIAVSAPLFMLVYGICRWIDGWDGDRHNGPAWTVGHLFFLVAVILFVVVGEWLRRRTRTVLAAAALAVQAAGAAGMVWVILGDLNTRFRQDYPLPDALSAICPAMFTLGMLTLLILETVARRVPVWTPVLFLAGFLALSFDLDLLPLGATLITVAMLPLAVPLRRKISA